MLNFFKQNKTIDGVNYFAICEELIKYFDIKLQNPFPDDCGTH